MKKPPELTHFACENCGRKYNVPICSRWDCRSCGTRYSSSYNKEKNIFEYNIVKKKSKYEIINKE